MKICFVIGDFTNGGVEAIIYNYLTHMDLGKMDVSVISYAKSDEKCYEKFKQLNITIYVVSPKKEAFFKSCVEVFDILKKQKFDIVHCHMTDWNCVPLALAFMVGTRVRISHSHMNECAHLKPGAKIFDTIKCQAGVLLATDYWACGRLAGERLFGKRRMESNKVRIMYNAVDSERFRYTPAVREDVRRELGISGKYCIGHVGRFAKQKNHAFIVELFQKVHNRVDNAVLLLVGDGKKRGEIEDCVHERGLDGAVIFLGTRNDIDRIYQAMDLYVLPSLYEGLPVSAIEAQISGLHTLLSDRITDEVLLSNLAMMLPIDNAQRWADAILEQMAKHSEAERTSRDLEEYNIVIQARIIEECYMEIARR